MKIRITLAALAGVAALATVGMTATAAGASTTPSPPVMPTVPACAVSQLTANLSSGYGFQFNHRDLTLTLTNSSWRACTVSGYPGLQLLGTRWQPLPTTVDHVFSWSQTPITLYPGQSATATISFTLAGRYSPGRYSPYYPYYAASAYLEVTLPSAYPIYPMSPGGYGWTQHFILTIPGGPVRIAQDKLSETALTGGFHFVW